MARAFTTAYPEFAPGVIVLDLVMPDMDGIEILGYLSGRASAARIILVSGAEATCLRMAGEIGSQHGLNIAGTVSKPFRVADLRRLLVPSAVPEVSPTS